jgi:8-oxo-dGTP pyrophosphatase MutT (NUDIX family)
MTMTTTKQLRITVKYNNNDGGYWTFIIDGRSRPGASWMRLNLGIGILSRRLPLDVTHGPYVSPLGDPDAGDPLACERPVKTWIDDILIPAIETSLTSRRNRYWADARIKETRLAGSHGNIARDVASRGPRLDSDVDLIRRNFVNNARLVLLGDFATLNNMCTSLRNVLASQAGAEFEGGLLTHASAERLNASGAADFFHFVAAVPVNALSALMERRDPDLMRDALRISDVDVGDNDITVDPAAFPGHRPGHRCEVGRLRGGRAALSDIATLENGGDVHVLVCGYDDSERKSAFTLNLPGGKRLLGESGLDCALREVFEETRLLLHADGFNGPVAVLPHHAVETPVRFDFSFGSYHIVASLPEEAPLPPPPSPSSPRSPRSPMTPRSRHRARRARGLRPSRGTRFRSSVPSRTALGATEPRFEDRSSVPGRTALDSSESRREEEFDLSDLASHLPLDATEPRLEEECDADDNATAAATATA